MLFDVLSVMTNGRTSRTNNAIKNNTGKSNVAHSNAYSTANSRRCVEHQLIDYLFLFGLIKLYREEQCIMHYQFGRNIRMADIRYKTKGNTNKKPRVYSTIQSKSRQGPVREPAVIRKSASFRRMFLPSGFQTGSFSLRTSQTAACPKTDL